MCSTRISPVAGSPGTTGSSATPTCDNVVPSGCSPISGSCESGRHGGEDPHASTSYGIFAGHNGTQPQSANRAVCSPSAATSDLPGMHWPPSWFARYFSLCGALLSRPGRAFRTVASSVRWLGAFVSSLGSRQSHASRRLPISALPEARLLVAYFVAAPVASSLRRSAVNREQLSILCRTP
jgi:hypothetical protein